MGKSLPSTTNLQSIASRIASSPSSLLKKPNFAKPISRFPTTAAKHSKSAACGGDVSESSRPYRRIPLAEVVSDCVNRWFQDTLKEAKSGDTAMQVLVGQMYSNGYGVPIDAQKGRAWISRASKNKSSVWKVCDKRPGYNASDSDSDDIKEDAK